MIAATYNVNSVNARIENLSRWLKEKSPDIVLLQEIKTETANFPFFELQTLGYVITALLSCPRKRLRLLKKDCLR